LKVTALTKERLAARRELRDTAWLRKIIREEVFAAIKDFHENYEVLTNYEGDKYVSSLDVKRKMRKFYR
jgi:hypothetical protein